jgi:hypothetical protein
MTVLTSPTLLGELIKREFDPDYTREVVTLKAGAAYPLGAVLGRVTATGVYTLSPKTATAGIEGAEIASAVLLQAVPQSATDVQAVALVRGPVIVAESALQFHASVADTDRLVKHQQLAAHGIVVRATA